METFYKGADVADKKALADQALAVIFKSIEDNRTQFKSQDEYDDTRVRVIPMMQTWYKEIGQHLHDEYSIVSVEQELKPKLGDAFTMTIRPDAVIKHKQSGTVVIPEHKTTGYSMNSQFETVTRGDQATAYCWGFLKMNPEIALNFGGVLLDVCYNRMSKTEVKQLSIVRNKTALVEFELSLLGVFLDLANRIRALESKPELLPMIFPRNGSACAAFGCEYEGICRNRITKGMVLGSEFMIDEWKGRDQLLADTEGESLEFRTFSSRESLDAVQITNND